MKKIGDHMRAMGFNENASDDVKRAFIKYLIKESQFHDRVTSLHKYKTEAPPVETPITETTVTDTTSAESGVVGEQLSLFTKLTGTD